jgi:hypothetical protein
LTLSANAKGNALRFTVKPSARKSEFYAMKRPHTTAYPSHGAILAATISGIVDVSLSPTP